MLKPEKTIAVAYLARGADKEWLNSFEKFLASYKFNRSGAEHSFYIIFKGFTSDSDLEKAKTLFSTVQYKPIFLDDNTFDIGAYIEWANMIDEDFICVFNTASQIMASDWLLKFENNLKVPNVGMVGATGSFESLNSLYADFPIFPNVHIRSTAFMIERQLFCTLTSGEIISDKYRARSFESGPNSISNLVSAKGKNLLIVGRNGRGYSPPFWPMSNTFRLGKQDNLLVTDNQTRSFSEIPWPEKKAFSIKTWGKYLSYKSLMKNSDRA